MSREVYCEKLKKHAPGLDFVPFKNELGQRIFDHICQEAWSNWLEHQTMIINEYRLNLVDAKARAFLTSEMEKFLFSSDLPSKPAGFTPVEDEK